MPRGDRSGPNGRGPMTGRGAGFCNGANSLGYMNIGAAGGCGLGAGRGFGIGFQPAYAVPVYSKEAEKKYLENEVSFLKDQLRTLEDRLADMQEDE